MTDHVGVLEGGLGWLRERWRAALGCRVGWAGREETCGRMPFPLCSFAVLVTGTVVYSKGDEREVAQDIAAGAYDADLAAAEEERLPGGGPGESRGREAAYSGSYCGVVFRFGYMVQQRGTACYVAARQQPGWSWVTAMCAPLLLPSPCSVIARASGSSLQRARGHRCQLLQVQHEYLSL